MEEFIWRCYMRRTELAGTVDATRNECGGDDLDTRLE
jgi:hypothetical protein